MKEAQTARKTTPRVAPRRSSYVLHLPLSLDSVTLWLFCLFRHVVDDFSGIVIVMFSPEIHC